MTREMDVADDDEALMLAYQKGDQQAFARLYQRYRQPLFGYLVNTLGNRAQAEEIFQDCWMTLIRQRERYVASARFRTYLFCIAHSRAIDHFRRQGRLPAHDLLDGEADDLPACPVADPDSRLEEEQLLERLQFCLRQLPEEQRAVMVLKLESELTLPDIAAQLGLAFETLKSRFRYAQKKLRGCLGLAGT